MFLEQRGFASGSARRHCESASNGRGGGASLDAPPPSFSSDVTIYTDGSCLGARGIGGWAFLIHGPADGERRSRAESHPRTTSSRMELTAAVRALGALEEPSRVRLVTDSTYVARGASEWLPRWKDSGWRSGSPGRTRRLKNVRLWQRLDGLLQQHEVAFEWVRGHSGHPENELVDTMARRAAVEAASP
jgi:ribonuclease HI